MKKDTWIEGTLKMEDLAIGQEYLNWNTKQLSILTNLTKNSVEMFNTADRKSFYKSGQVDADGEVQRARLKGFDSFQWYTLQDFNRSFKEIDVIKHKLEHLKIWLNTCIDKQKWTKFVC